MIEFSIPPQPSAQEEAVRLDTFEWCDETPIGRYVTREDQLVISVTGLLPDAYLSVIVGFKPTWSANSGREEIRLTEGANSVFFSVSGPVFIRHIGRGPDVRIHLSGGKPLALWTWDGGWLVRDDVGLSPWVQYVSDRVLITLPRGLEDCWTIPHPIETFSVIHRILTWCDELSGRTDVHGRHQPCRNRMHFLTDIWAPAQEREQFYMYAFEGYIAVLPENIKDLTEPARLKTQWGIWHELGHMYQPHSWTWDAHVEVNVNLWSLFVQQRFGQPSRLEEEPCHRMSADLLIAEGKMDMTKEGDPFVQLVMLERLSEMFGWQIFAELNRRYRDTPLAESASDDLKISQFCINLQHICKGDISDMLRSWGFKI